jgi:integrase
MIDDLRTPIGVQQKLIRHADVRTTMSIDGSAFEETKRRVNARIAELVLPFAPPSMKTRGLGLPLLL